MSNTQKTNLEMIQQSTKHELACFLDRSCEICEACVAYDRCCDGYCTDCVAMIEHWLETAADLDEWSGLRYGE